MKYPFLKVLQTRPFFTVEDVQALLGIRLDSARVLCARYVRQGLFIRLKRNFYLLTERWNHLTREEFIFLANMLQVPSYLSFTSALAYHEVTTQVQQGFWESACLRRSRLFRVEGVVFQYYKLRREYYFGFSRREDLFIATPEKAMLDAVYLHSLGKYPMDVHALDLQRLDLDQIWKWADRYPPKTRKTLQRICQECGI